MRGVSDSGRVRAGAEAARMVMRLRVEARCCSQTGVLGRVASSGGWRRVCCVLDVRGS